MSTVLRSEGYRVAKGPFWTHMVFAWGESVEAGVFLAPGEDLYEVLCGRQQFLPLIVSGEESPRLVSVDQIHQVAYPAEADRPGKRTEIPARLRMVDGSQIEGVVRESLPVEHSRLLDSLNIAEERFLRLYNTEGSRVLLVHKRLIAYVVDLSR